METSLVVDFHGPIAYRFGANCVWAYLPLCRSHRLNVLTDTDDIGPDRHNVFKLTGPKAGKTQTGGANLILLDWKKDTEGKEPPVERCYCIFELPLPDFIFGLRAEWVAIKKHTGGGWSDYYARGLRFWYNDCPHKPAIEPHKPDQLAHLNATCAQPDNGSGVRYRMEIRYYDINPVYDPDLPHADALECSQTMCNLLPPLDKWTVDFEHPNKPKPPTSVLELGLLQLGTIPPVDCGANGFVFNDGGLTIP